MAAYLKPGGTLHTQRSQPLEDAAGTHNKQGGQP